MLQWPGTVPCTSSALLMRIRPLLAIWPLLPVLGGCTDLTEIEFSSCGNNVLDPGEDCDGYDAGPETHCIAPRQTAECHFSCGPQDAGQAYLCPKGMGCGVDSICREAAGTFAAPQITVAPAGRWMHLGAFDGDGRADLATLRGPSLEVHYFGATGQIEQSYQTFATLPKPGRPLAGDVSGDGLHDLVGPGPDALSVLVASATRFRPWPSIWRPIPNGAAISTTQRTPCTPPWPSA